MFKVSAEISALNKILSMKIETFFMKKKVYSKYAFLKKIGRAGFNRKVVNKFIDMGILVLENEKYYIDILAINKHWKESEYMQVHKKIQRAMPPITL